MAGVPVRQIEVPFDARFFLEVPDGLRGDGAGAQRLAWLHEVCATNTVADEWHGDADALVRRLDLQSGLLSPDAFGAFLFCPRGLPADALVEVHVSEVDAATLDEIVHEPMRVAVPERVRPVVSETLGEGRVTSSVAATTAGGAIGELRFEFLRDGVLVEVCAAGAELGALGAALPLLEEFAGGIRVDAVAPGGTRELAAR